MQLPIPNVLYQMWRLFDRTQSCTIRCPSNYNAWKIPSFCIKFTPHKSPCTTITLFSLLSFQWLQCVSYIRKPSPCITSFGRCTSGISSDCTVFPLTHRYSYRGWTPHIPKNTLGDKRLFIHIIRQSARKNSRRENREIPR